MPKKDEAEAAAAEAATESDSENPTTEPTTEEDASAEMVAAKRGRVFVTYQGHANSASFKDPESGVEMKFEPGVPVEVPKGIAEALQTTPFEEFEVSAEAPAPPPEVEE